MHKYYFLLAFTFMACASDKPSNTAPRSCKIIFSSSERVSLQVSLAKELDEDAKSAYSITPGDTLVIPLQDDWQIIDLSYHNEWYHQVVVAKGEVLQVDKSGIYKLTDTQREAVKSTTEEAFGESKSRIELQEAAKILSGYKYDDAEKLKQHFRLYLQANKEYYEKLREAFLEKGTAKAKILADVVLVEQYKSLWAVNEVVQDSATTALLKSDKFINEEHFRNRNLSPVFNQFTYYNQIKNAGNKTLVEKYKSDYVSYPEVIQAYFKRQLIINMILKKYDRKTIISHLDNYIAEYGPNKQLEQWMKDIEYGVTESDDLLLTDANNKKYTWQTLLKQYKGKVVYVDFWASWCGPCIGEMPSSKKLHHDLKDVVFVYLALNDEADAWRKAMERHQVQTHSYLVTNSKSSNFVTGHKITSIPRYMIIDKNGKMHNPDAPRPSSAEIRYLLKEVMNM